MGLPGGLEAARYMLASSYEPALYTFLNSALVSSFRMYLVLCPSKGGGSLQDGEISRGDIPMGEGPGLG